MFSDAGNGQLGALDYWRDVSYGQFSISGTVVKGWYTLGITRDTWAGYSRSQKWSSCAAAAKPHVNYANYVAAIVVFPEAASTTTAALNTAATSVTVASTTTGDGANFPTPPFQLVIDDGSTGNAETVTVTAVSGTTFTVTRSASPMSHAGGAQAIVPGDLFGFGPGSVTLGGDTFTLGGVVAAHDIPLNVYTHEMGHGFGFNHSRALTQSTTDYNDCFDIMSALTCVYSFTGAGTTFGGSTFGGTAKGPGLNAVQVDIQGWIASGRKVTFNNATCNQTTYAMAALNHPEVTGNLAIKIPATVSIAVPASEGSPKTSDFYYLELRSKTGWDRGIPADAFVLHLHAAGRTYWVDTAGTAGSLRNGAQFADAAENVYLAVNRIRSGNFDGDVTISGCKINATATYTGPTTGDTTDGVTLTGTLLVTGSNVPVPNAPVTLSVGTQSCTDTTDATGAASCNVTLTQTPGAVSASISYAGTATYNAASDTDPFTITPETTTTTYSGDTTSDYHDVFTATATLVDDDAVPTPVVGRTVTFTLGAGDTCSDTTDSSGVASCSITPTQPAGAVNIVSAFAGDTHYTASSDTEAFVITHEETTLTYTGPTVNLQGARGVALRAQLLEDGLFPPVPSGQTITLSLGGQTCTGTTDSAGNASCTLTFTGPLGPEPISATFAGDAYYEPSSDTDDTAIVFAFPERGSFTLGDTTVAAATSTTSVTWWGAHWSSLNVLSGGPAPSADKGFAADVQSLPTTSPPATCAGTWTTGGGSSSDPASTVPSYMGVLVTPDATQSGSTIAGSFAKIVVVKTDPGFSGAPGHPGTGVIVATFCG